MSADRAGQYHYKDTPRLPLKGYDHQGRFTKAVKRQMLLLSSGTIKRIETFKPLSLTSVCRKVMEQIILETISKHVTDRKVMGS